MIISIHQPNFLPWPGYFYKIAKSDCFVFLDDVQYTKNSFINRNKIRAGDEDKWLTCPVLTAGHFGNPIISTSYFQPVKSMNRVLGMLTANYSKTPWFHRYFDMIRNEVDFTGLTLAEQNIALIRAVMQELDIKTPTIRSSELHGVTGSSTSRLISICRQLNGDAYLAGFGSVKYQEDELFEHAGIKLIKTEFSYPTYQQAGPGFVKNLSVIDMLFNLGSKAKECLSGSGVNIS